MPKKRRGSDASASSEHIEDLCALPSLLLLIRHPPPVQIRSEPDLADANKPVRQIATKSGRCAILVEPSNIIEPQTTYSPDGRTNARKPCAKGRRCSRSWSVTQYQEFPRPSSRVGGQAEGRAEGV